MFGKLFGCVGVCVCGYVWVMVRLLVCVCVCVGGGGYEGIYAWMSLYQSTASSDLFSGKFYKAIFEILKFVGEEFGKLSEKESAKHLHELEQLFKNTAQRGKVGFARRILAKILVMYNKVGDELLRHNYEE